MNNFFEKALALRNQYYDDEVQYYDLVDEFRLKDYGPPNHFTERPDPCISYKIEILSELVAIYLQYGESIPNDFSIKLSSVFNTDYLAEVLQQIFNDLSIDVKVDSVSHVHYLCIYSQFASTYAYSITLLK